ncbi:SDR family oxidoreductase [Mumia sp. DW29H23]|uniref:SDR family oxidoreductase n=1 Tax=Mumia sp. DW29H23 TaxID=3421241 RepID=UPI003D6924C8
MSTLIGITGATGQIGSATARHLADAGYATRLVVRDAARAPRLPRSEVAVASYDDAGACRTAYDGIDTLFLVSATESADRVTQHRTAVDAAVAAGVRQVVYLSFAGAGPDATFTLARDHGATEEHVKATPLAWTFLRDNLYTDAIRTMFGEDGAIRGPAGQGKVASVAQADVAEVAARVLGDPTAHAGAAYELTGPAALTLTEIAALLTEATGTPHRYVEETIAEAHASRAHYGAPDWMVEAWISTYTAIRDGELDRVSSDIPELLGRPALSVAEVFSGRRAG